MFGVLDNLKGSRGRRVLIATAAAALFGALASMLAGPTFGLFSASTSSSSKSFTTGTVTQTNSMSGTCNLSNLLPDDSSHSCTLQVSYDGSAAAYLGLDVLIETQAGAGGTELYNPGDPTNDLQVTINSTNPSVSYAVPATATSCPGTAPPGSICYEVDKQLVSTTAITNAHGPVTFTTTVSLPHTSPTGYQGGSAQIILNAHTAQASNNSASGCTPGQTCTAVSWS